MGHSPFTRACRNAALAILTVGLLAGCTTAAQRQYQAMATGNREIIAQIKSCGTEVYNAPEAAVLRPHSPLDVREATLAQLSDQSLPTKQEVAAVLAIHPVRPSGRLARADVMRAPRRPLAWLAGIDRKAAPGSPLVHPVENAVAGRQPLVRYKPRCH